MLKLNPSTIFGVNPKILFSSIMIVINPLIWYYAIYFFLQRVALNSLDFPEILLVFGFLFLGIILSAFLGAALAKNFKESNFLIFWMVLGIISPFFLVITCFSGPLTLSMITLLLGISLGLGMPTSMNYYCSSIPVEKRGKISGVIMFFFVLGILLTSIVGFTTPIILGIILSSWRLFGLITYVKLDPFIKMDKPIINPSYSKILSQQKFILYFIPWVMFSLINYLPNALQVTLLSDQLIFVLQLILNVFMAIFVVIGGFLLDYLGRKRIAVAGFVLLGIGFSFLSAFPTSPALWYLSSVMGGIAWGFLFVIFILTIWGDLSPNSRSDKYYALGVTPFFASQFLGITFGGFITNMFPVHGFLSFITIFLFLAVLPLIYAPETLPEKTLKSRELKNYAEKAKKKALKEATKNQKK